MFERVVWLLLLGAAAAARADEPRENSAAIDKALRDPMQPYRALPGGAAAAAAYRFHLTSVLISPARRIAIVNGRPLEVGDAVDGAEIVRIDAEAVHLTQGGDELLIYLGRPGNGERPSAGVSVP